MRKLFFLLALVACVGCERMGDDARSGNVTLRFVASQEASTRATVYIGDYFSKLNIMLFDADGEKAFDKVKTQLIDDDGFGQMNLSLAPGRYTIVAVGHSSIKSATIKSPVMVQFTASDGEKLTDTFCYCGAITVGDKPEYHDLVMSRVSAMFRLKITDDDIPESFARMKFDYTGGSANFNPSTFEGTTKSTQSENRQRDATDTYSCFTFPYLATTCNLKMTVSALDADGNVIRQRKFDAIPVTRNKITTYTGRFFLDGDGNITQSGFGFTVNADWDGEDVFDF